MFVPESAEKLNGGEQHNAPWSRDTGTNGGGGRGRTRPVALHFSFGSLIVESEQKVTFQAAAVDRNPAGRPGAPGGRWRSDKSSVSRRNSTRSCAYAWAGGMPCTLR